MPMTKEFVWAHLFTSKAFRSAAHHPHLRMMGDEPTEDPELSLSAANDDQPVWPYFPFPDPISTL
jgi:hypothetical protein